MAVNPLPPGPWLRFVLYWLNGDTKWQNDVWYHVSGIGDQADLVTVLSDFTTLISTWLCSPVCNLNSILYAVKLYANNGTYTASVANYPLQVGGQNAGAVPIQVSVVGALNSEVATRQANGRLFLAGLDTQMLGGDYPSPSAVMAVNTFLGKIKGFVSSLTWSFALAIWDRKTAILHDVIDYAISGKLGTRIKRRPRI